MPPSVFITGVAGFLGSHLADAFLARGFAVRGCDSLIGGDRSNVPAGVEFSVMDCNELETLTRAMRGSEIVYHCAATAYEGLSVFSPHLVTHNIVGASVATFTAAIRVGARRVIFCSSMARYGSNTVPFREEMHPRPQDPYGIGKVAAEALMRNLCDVHGVEWTVAVPHNIYGPRQKFDDPFRNVVSIMINLMLQGRQPIIYGDGEQRRCFSYIADDLPVLEQLADHPGVASEIVNIGPDEEFISINELAKRVAGLLGFELAPLYVTGRPQEVTHANCSADKARRLLNYRTRHSLEDGLAATIEWIRGCGPRPFAYHLPIEILTAQTPKTWTERRF